MVSVSYTKVTTGYNFLTKVYTSTHTATLVNTSNKTLSTPLHGVLIFNDLVGAPTVTGASGGFATSPYQNYYYDLSGKVAGGSFAPGASLSITVTIQRKSGTVYSSTVIKPYAVVPVTNTPPTADAGAPQTITLQPGQTTAGVTLSGAASSDSDGTVTAYSWSGNPDPADVQSPTLNLGAGNYTFTLVVTDDKGAQSAPAQVSVTVNPAPNLPPTADAGPPQTVTLQKGEASAAVTLAGSGQDSEANGSIAGYSWSGIPDPADVQNPTLNLGVGSHTFTLIVTDNQGAQSAPSQVTVTVLAAPNTPPVLDPIGARTVAEGELLSFTVSGSDADLDTLIFSTGTLPAGAAFSAATRTFNWTPGFDQAGAHPVAFNLSDGTAVAGETVQITVVNSNRKPALAEIPAKTVAEDSTLAFALAGSDPDGDTLTFSAASLPSGATLDPGTGEFSWRPGFSQGGSYKVTFAVSDGTASDERSADLTVTDLNRNPGIVTESLPAPRIDRPYGEAVAAVDPDGDTLTFTLTGAPAGMGIGAASGAIDWIPTIAAMGNSYPFTVSVSDGRGGSDSRDYTLSIPDTIPPAVKLNAPREVVPGASFTVSAVATDNVAVTGLSIDSGSVNCSAVDNCRSELSASQAMAPGSVIVVIAQARDAAGNEGIGRAEISIAAAPDTEPPAVTLSAPLLVTRGQRITLAATATDNQGVASLAFADQGETIGTATPPFTSVQYQVPADAVVGSKIPFMVTATDFSNLTASALAESEVVESADDAPPVITLAAPATVVAGRILPVTLKVTDDRGVTNVDLMLSHRKVSSFAKAVEQVIDLPVPMETEAGTRLAIDVTATDASGNSSTSSVTTTVEVLQGLLTGAVYDDTTGAPLKGAEVVLTVAGRTPLSASTDLKGHYSFVADEGSGTISVKRSGYSRVDRPGVGIVVNSGRRVRDARLTPVPAAAGNVPSILGGAVSAPFTASGGGLSSSAPAGRPADGTMTLTIAPGSLAADTPVTLTQIGAQGLQGGLPEGWSPAAAFLAAPAAAAFASPAAVLLPNLLALPAGGSYPLVKWDEGRGAWFGAGSATVSGNGVAVSAEITAAGEYALLVPDQGALLSVPAAGELLAGTAAAPLPADASALVLPQPKIIFYKPGVKSEVGTTLSPAAGPPSGTVVWAEIGEEYNFFTGQKMAGEPFTQDIVLYSFGREGRPLAADYFVSPTLDFAGLALNVGTITVTAAAPPADAELVTVVGSAGGTFATAGGESLTVPPGAVKSFIPLSLSSLQLSRSGITLPGGIDFVAGAMLGLAGNSLALPAALSLPAPAGFAPVGDLALVRAIEFNGETRLAFVAAASFSGGSIVSSIDLLGTGAAKGPGVTVEGRYLVIDTRRRVGYAGGVVTGIDQAPFTGALVSSETLPLASLSVKGGRYVIPVAGAPFTMSAVDPVKRDRGAAAGTGIVGAFTPVDLAMQAEPPSVSATTPAASSVGAALADPVRITFSEPVDPASIVQANFTLTAATGGVPCTLELSSGNSVVTMRHAEPLAPATVYTLAIQGVRDLAGYTMGATFSATFTSLDTNPPPAPPAANLAASIPGDAGTTTVTGTQGSAGLHDTLYIVNLTTGARNQVQVDPDGGFSATIAATIKDRLQLEITSPAGVSTTVGLPKFRKVNPDGSIAEVAGPEGGWIDGPGGTAVEVPKGAFPEGAVITMTALDEASFPVQLSEQDRKYFGYSGGIDLDFGGKTPLQYLNVSVPTRPGDSADDRWVVVQAVEMNGRMGMASIDTARIIGGRVTTSSPPCPGVTSKGGYAFIKSFLPMGVAYGNIGPSAAGYSAEVASNDVMLAYGINLNGTYAFCTPVFSTDLTVTYNTVDIVVDSTALRPPVNEVTVTNNTAGSKSRFPSKDLFYDFEISGAVSDSFKMVQTDALSVESELASYRVEESKPGFVQLKLNVNDVTFSSTSDKITVHNLTRTSVSPVATAAADIKARVTVDGGMTDSFEVAKIDPQAAGTSIMFGAVASPYGSKNMLFKVIPGALAPVRPGGVTLTKMILTDGTAGAEYSIPLASLTPDDGLTYNFPGKLTNDHSFKVKYSDGSEASQNIGKFTIKLKDAQGAVVKEITLPSPLRDVKLPVGTLHDIPGAPLMLPLVPELQHNFDPSRDQLTFTFTEPLNATVEDAGTIVITDSSGAVVEGKLKLWGENGNMVTFIPAAPLKLGMTYTVTVTGVMDLGGDPVYQTPFTVTTAGPSLVKRIDLVSPTNIRPFPPQKDIPLNDIAMTTFTDSVSGDEVTSLVAVTDTRPDEFIYRYATFNVTFDPYSSSKVGDGYGGGGKQRVHIVKGADLQVRDLPLGCSAHVTGDATSGYRFKGSIAVASSSIPNWMTTVSFFDVTDPASPCQLGGKMLTADPANLSDYSRFGTFHTSGNAKGVTVLGTPGGAYTALVGIGDFGVMSVDIGKNIPDQPPRERQREGLFSGEFPEVIAAGDNIYLLNANPQNPQLEIYDANFIKAGVMPLPQETTGIVYAGPVKFDVNRDGTLKSFDLLLSFGRSLNTVQILDVSDRRQPKHLGRIKFDKQIKAIGFDRNRMKLIAAAADKLYLADITTFNDMDLNLDGKDDRVVWSADSPDRTLKCIRTDEARGLFYVGTSNSLDIYRLAPKNLTGFAKYIRFDMKQPAGTDPGGLDFDAVNPPEKPIRSAIIELRDKVTDAVIDRTLSNEQGFYALNAPLNKDLVIVARAAVTTDPKKPEISHLRVIKPPADRTAITAAEMVDLYEAKSEDFKCTSLGCQKDLLAKQKWVWTTAPVAQAPPCSAAACKDAHYGVGSYTVRDASPFALLDSVYEFEDRFKRQVDPRLTFVDLTLIWGPALSGATEALTTRGIISINGAVSDTDEYDYIIVGHEWMHIFQATKMRSDSPGGSHSAGERSDPLLAYNEAVATSHSLILNNDPVYFDTGLNGRFHPGYAVDDYNAGVTNKGFYDENSLTEVIYKLVKDVKVPLSELYAADIKQKTATPFVSIFSFLHDLADRHFAAGSATRTTFGDPIDALLRGKNIIFEQTDPFEPTVAKLYNPITTSRLSTSEYRNFTADIGNNIAADTWFVGEKFASGDPLTTSALNDPANSPTWTAPNGNKLHERLYFKFSLDYLLSGKYRFKVKPTMCLAPPGATGSWGAQIEVLRSKDKTYITTESSADVDLPKGDYVMSVSTYSDVGPDPDSTTGGRLYTNAPCKVVLTIEPLWLP